LITNRHFASFKLLPFKLCTKLRGIFELFITVNFAVVLEIFPIRAGPFRIELICVDRLFLDFETIFRATLECGLPSG
jgi:hypothetical protein